MHFFDIATSKSGPRMVLWHFSLPNVIRATAPCTFSTSQLPKVAWDRQFLTLFTSRCASRHSGPRLLDTSSSKSSASMCCSWHFNLDMCFAATMTCNFSRLAYLYAHLHLLSSDLSPSLIFPIFYLLSSDFLLVWASSCRCFPAVHLVGSLTSKLPSASCNIFSLSAVAISNVLLKETEHSYIYIYICIYMNTYIWIWYFWKTWSGFVEVWKRRTQWGNLFSLRRQRCTEQGHCFWKANPRNT